MEKQQFMIHYVSERAVEGRITRPVKPVFYPRMCDAHTHGLDRLGSPELQIVIEIDPKLLAYIFNSVAAKIGSGEEVKDGDIIRGLFEDEDMTIEVCEMPDSFGQNVLRLILPDTAGRHADESDEYPYCLQKIGPYKETKEKEE